ncbi:ABC transporter permease subunit [Nocardioides cavernae]|uniref:ABC transporter permease subunit n=1 Tax=Nocardioides cavernae TaxID=1921566 RepID=A0ABR8N6B0_9ACTN|nr:ABC transporter permease subunit [Nocardioides cavernae]MBD3923032.1 ABC transporter permease subunit [Nocardioides cavernae]MBM7512048.1 putative spermidine/putrescine transport system permease protein [Nocardioides cavernae]
MSGGPGRRFAVGPALPLLPFLLFVLVFLVVPTLTVVLGAFQDEDGRPTLGNLDALTSEAALTALRGSLVLSASTAVIGAVLGAVLAYLIVSMPAQSLLRRATLAVSGVLAQFGGVVLAFAWIATIGPVGVVTQAVADLLGADLYGDGWLFGLPGLVVVYSYFQIPLMVIVFTPAFDGLRPQWREAAVNLGASTWTYWRYVALPLLTPPFLGALLLLFANAFAAYATAAVLVSQGQPIVPLLIRQAITSEVLLGQANVGYALAFEMIVVVTVVMVGYSLLLRRAARWMR